MIQISVPIEFVRELRKKQLFKLGLISLGLAAIAILASKEVMLVAIGVPLSAMIQMLFAAKYPTWYVFNESGIYLTYKKDSKYTISSFSLPRYWIYWQSVDFLEFEQSHWKGLPAMRLIDQRKQSSWIIPMNNQDVDAVMKFLGKLSKVRPHKVFQQ